MLSCCVPSPWPQCLLLPRWIFLGVLRLHTVSHWAQIVGLGDQIFTQLPSQVTCVPIAPCTLGVPSLSNTQGVLWSSICLLWCTHGHEWHGRWIWGMDPICSRDNNRNGHRVGRLQPVHLSTFHRDLVHFLTSLHYVVCSTSSGAARGTILRTSPASTSSPFPSLSLLSLHPTFPFMSPKPAVPVPVAAGVDTCKHAPL